jgi:hypothetical protein
LRATFGLVDLDLQLSFEGTMSQDEYANVLAKNFYLWYKKLLNKDDKDSYYKKAVLHVVMMDMQGSGMNCIKPMDLNTGLFRIPT